MFPACTNKQCAGTFRSANGGWFRCDVCHVWEHLPQLSHRGLAFRPDAIAALFERLPASPMPARDSMIGARAIPEGGVR